MKEPNLEDTKRDHTFTRIPNTKMAGILRSAIASGQITADDSAVIFYDITKLKHTLDELRMAFPEHTIHAIATKANPVLKILELIHNSNCALEVASVGELHLALAAGFHDQSIVFDSPVKTRDEIDLALQLDATLNANSLAELERFASSQFLSTSRSAIGIRINPEVGQGTIISTSVGAKHSKFGVPISTYRTEIIAAFAKYEWLRGLHLHIGSQGMSREQLLAGVAVVYDLFLELGGSARVTSFNIGGGLPAQYRNSESPVSFQDYATELRRICPALFQPNLTLTTEFGRSIHAACSWVATKVEYVIEERDCSPTVFVHVGADMFLRKAYRPDDWHHDLSVCDQHGIIRNDQRTECRVAGPLCFAGDYLEGSVLLPESTVEGDYILVHEAGAYTFSMWSLYNSRQFPKMIGYAEETPEFVTLNARQKLSDIVSQWSRS